MALIICSECGKEFSDKAYECPNCGCPTKEMIKKGNTKQEKKYSTFHKVLYGNNENAKEAIKSSSTVFCPKCKSRNIQISLESVGEKTSGRNEVREKSSVTKTGNKLGRTAMIGITGGLWALTPKKSDYSEKKNSKTKYVQKKIALCQDCGNMWNII